MEADLQSHVAFYLTGRKQPTLHDDISELNLRPALFSGYSDLTQLRYDYPLLLVDTPTTGRSIETLSGVIDAILSKIAAGPNGDQLRKHVLRLEQDIRTRVAKKGGGRLSAVWDEAATTLSRKDKAVAESLSQARANLKVDGELADCSADVSGRVVAHVWSLAQRQRSESFNRTVARLLLKLSEILQADFARSDAGKSAASLKQSFGSGPMDSFNFDAMSRILKKAPAAGGLSKTRRQRVTNLIATLQSQRFFPSTATKNGAANSPYVFAFDSCGAALKAYQERLPKAIELARALAIAELEVKGEYNEAKHDRLFDYFGENGLTGEELSLFPDYLVRLNATALNGPEQSTLTEIFSADLPIKVLVQTDDILESSLVKNGHFAFTLRSKQLARMTMGLGVYVMQAPASNLYAMRGHLQRGIDNSGPALFSVYSGASTHTATLPPYLVSAAARECRLFPSFAFNPAAGNNWAARFSLEDNPQPENDWVAHSLVYQDEHCQTVRIDEPFTLLDFIACDRRYAKHFARVPRNQWNGLLVSAADILNESTSASIEGIPFLLMVDATNTLQKIVVDEKMIREARRCLTMWNTLQELGGIRNSHAAQLLAREKAAWEESGKIIEAASAAVAPAPTPAPAAASAAAAPVEAEVEKSPDEAYIETPRCASCNECIQINDKMFVYDGNKQAFIADINAGTFAQLVEAAENCQVAIIHPGKPRNADEPGLEDLIKRAEAFL